MESPQEHGMEHASEAWDCWLNEEFKLDSDSPMDMSDSLWDSIGQCNETVARSLFACTAQAKDASTVGKEASPQTSSSWHHPSLGSEGMLNLLVDEHVHPSPCLSDSFEGCDGSFPNACENLAASPNSIWFMPKEDSLCSSPCIEPMEQSAESWMTVFDDDNDNDMHVQGRTQHGRDVMAPRVSPSRAHGTPCRTRHAQRGMRPSQEFLESQNGANTRKLASFRGRQASKHTLLRSVSDSQVVQECSKPVVYPFALVKPSGIQGDATLKDINERINMVSSPSRPSNTPCPSTSSPFSGKPVVAVTKIHTEGKGTITIMRTRS